MVNILRKIKPGMMKEAQDDDVDISKLMYFFKS